MYPQRIAIIVLVLFLGACGTFFDFSKDVETPIGRLAAATGYYALALEGVNSLHESGVISDSVLVNKIAPAQQAAKTSLAEAEQLISTFGGASNANVENALKSASRQALTFYNLYLEFK